MLFISLFAMLDNNATGVVFGEKFIEEGWEIISLIHQEKSRDILLTKASHPFDPIPLSYYFTKHVLIMLRCMKCFQVVCATKEIGRASCRERVCQYV